MAGQRVTPTNTCLHCGKGVWLAVSGLWTSQSMDGTGYTVCFRAPLAPRTTAGVTYNTQVHAPVKPLDTSNVEEVEKWLASE